MTATRIDNLEIREPCVSSVRVAIVLPDDLQTTLNTTQLCRDFELISFPDKNSTPTRGKDRLLISPGAVVSFEAVQDRIRVHAGSESRTSISWRLIPTPEGAAGNSPDMKPLIRMENLRAGRGFHWQTHCSQIHTGRIEIRACEGHLVVVAELDVEDYITGVISSEMGESCPVEFLKAQAVAARSWLLARSEQKHRDIGVDFCNDDCCQRFHGLPGNASSNVTRAVEATRGEVLVSSEGSIVDANYGKCCGGITEGPEHAWGRPKAGMRAVVDAPPQSAFHSYLPVAEPRIESFLELDPQDSDAYCSPTRFEGHDLAGWLGRVDDGQGRFRWNEQFTRVDVEQWIQQRHLDVMNVDDVAAAPLAELTNLEITRRGVSGRATGMRVEYRDAAGRETATSILGEYNIRRLLHPTFLYSSAVQFHLCRTSAGTIESVVIRGAGWGHGAGMCQIGALGRALEGWGYRDILRAYYPDAELHSP